MAIDAALDELPEEFRAAVVLRDVADLDYAEIAEALGVPVGTVKSRIARGRSQLADAAREPRPAPMDVQAPRAPHGCPATDPSEPIMTDDQLLLANAYVDDDVDDAARARAEADPEVMAEVDAAARRCAPSSATSASPTRRVASGPSPPRSPRSPTNRRRSRRRPRRPLPHRRAQRLVGRARAAAAALIVVVAGAVVLRGAGDGGDGDDSAADADRAGARERRTPSDAEAADAGRGDRDAAAPTPPAGTESRRTESARRRPTSARRRHCGRGSRRAVGVGAEPTTRGAARRTPERRPTRRRAPSVEPRLRRRPARSSAARRYDGRPVEVSSTATSITRARRHDCAVVVRVGP